MGGCRSAPCRIGSKSWTAAALKAVLLARVIGVEVYHPEPGKPHMSVRPTQPTAAATSTPTGNTAAAAETPPPPPRHHQHHHQRLTRTGYMYRNTNTPIEREALALVSPNAVPT